MQSTIVITGNGEGLDDIAGALPGKYPFGNDGYPGITYATNRLFISITHEEELSQLYEEEDLLAVKAIFPEPVFFVVSYNNFELLKECVLALWASFPLVVDNDMGYIVKEREELEGMLWQRDLQPPD